MQRYANNAATTLTAPIATPVRPVAFAVDDASAFPTEGDFNVIIDDELILVTSVVGSTFTGSNTESTTATIHAAGSAVTQILTRAGLLASPGPMTTAGDVFYLDASGNPVRRGIGTDGQVMVVASGVPNWTSVLELNPPDGVTPIQVTLDADGRIWELTTASTGNAVDFGLLYNKNTFASGGAGNEAYINDVVSLGFNLGTVVSVPGVAGKASMYFTFEQKYYTASAYVSELHVELVDTAGVSHRPWTWAIKHDGTGGTHTITIDTLTFNDWAGNDKVQFNLATENISINDGTYLLFTENNAPVAKQSNAANDSFLNLPYINDENRLRMSTPTVYVADTPTTGTYANTFTVFQATTLPANGILLSGVMPSVTGSAYCFHMQGSFTGRNIGRIYNASNTSAADSVLYLDTREAGGDPFVRYYDNSAFAWAVGMDRSDSQKFKWGNIDLGSADKMVLTKTGDLSFIGSLTITDKDIVLSTGTGTKIGTGTTQKLAFYNANPIAQGASVADASGGTVVDAEARTAINALISRIEATGLIATV